MTHLKLGSLLIGLIALVLWGAWGGGWVNTAKAQSTSGEDGTVSRAEMEQALAEVEAEMVMYGRRKPVGKSWIEEKGEIYGAKADERGPIGGGEGYRGIVTKGDYRVTGLDELVAALGKAQAGQVVLVAGEAEIDCTTRVYIDKLVLEVPGGVTLAGERGRGGSRGALIYSDALATRPLIRAGGAKVRITGLRLRGPNPERRIYHHRRSFAEKRGHTYYYKFPVSDGIISEHGDLEVDNCELAGWSHGAITLRGGTGSQVHHNYIHHNQYNGLGYGLSLDRAETTIQYNLFDFNRHSIAGTGRPGTNYEASHNIELGDSLSHCFDMHGGRDRKDGTDIAGTWIRIHHNTFRARQTPIVIRGTPEKECRVWGNWFWHHSKSGENGGRPAVRSEKKTNVENNWYGK